MLGSFFGGPRKKVGRLISGSFFVESSDVDQRHPRPSGGVPQSVEALRNAPGCKRERAGQVEECLGESPWGRRDWLRGVNGLITHPSTPKQCGLGGSQAWLGMAWLGWRKAV